jgi:hypothetical protein
MNRLEAYHVLRCHVALGDEGIGPEPGRPEDSEILDRAARLAGDLIPEYSRWVFEQGREPGWWRTA